MPKNLVHLRQAPPLRIRPAASISHPQFFFFATTRRRYIDRPPPILLLSNHPPSLDQSPTPNSSTQSPAAAASIYHPQFFLVESDASLEEMAATGLGTLMMATVGFKGWRRRQSRKRGGRGPL
ncbi:unnamed protein product [Linum trigynum]|uniref:Uncharacterized protein n=1 Tax=Linum trigynum TaxID=586398 RepID=A0AAV2E1K4_9ROSI